MKADNPTDDCCKHVLASDDMYMYGTTTHSLAREVLRLRALERAVRELLEASDIDGGQQRPSYAMISPGDLALILNRADRAK